MSYKLKGPASGPGSRDGDDDGRDLQLRQPRSDDDDDNVGAGSGSEASCGHVGGDCVGATNGIPDAAVGGSNDNADADNNADDDDNADNADNADDDDNADNADDDDNADNADADNDNDNDDDARWNRDNDGRSALNQLKNDGRHGNEGTPRTSRARQHPSARSTMDPNQPRLTLGSRDSV